MERTEYLFFYVEYQIIIKDIETGLNQSEYFIIFLLYNFIWKYKIYYDKLKKKTIQILYKNIFCCKKKVYGK